MMLSRERQLLMNMMLTMVMSRERQLLMNRFLLSKLRMLHGDQAILMKGY